MLKTKVITISGGRDDGRRYLITEKPAMQVEKWAWRALSAIGSADVDLPEDVRTAGIAGLVAFAARKLLSADFAAAEPLMDEMLECVQVMPDPAHPQLTRPHIPEDFLDLSTLLLLRSEVIELHTGFSIPAGLSKLGAAAKEWASAYMSTSPKPSEPA